MEIEIRRSSPTAPWRYSDLDRRQRQVADRVRAGGPGAILLSEVASVITLGRRTPANDLLFNAEKLAASGIEVQSTDRGGLATYHGPGQWVLFVVDSLERLTGDRKGVRKAVNGLLNIAYEVGRHYRPDAEVRFAGETGVWSARGKFAAMGIHIEQRVLLHGIAVNGWRTEQSFQGLRPCGLDAPVDYLLASPDEFDRLGDQLVRQTLREFPIFSTS